MTNQKDAYVVPVSAVNDVSDRLYAASCALDLMVHGMNEHFNAINAIRFLLKDTAARFEDVTSHSLMVNADTIREAME